MKTRLAMLKPAVVLLCALSAGTALAVGTADDLIKARQDAMKGNADALAALVSIVRGVQPYDPAAVQASLAKMSANLATETQGNLWDPTTQQGSAVQTRALPTIWQNPQGFTDAQKGLEEAIAAVGGSTDMTTFKAAFPKLGTACKSCHETFRAPEG